jgi:hypothetical protein
MIEQSRARDGPDARGFGCRDTIGGERGDGRCVARRSSSAVMIRHRQRCRMVMTSTFGRVGSRLAGRDREGGDGRPAVCATIARHPNTTPTDACQDARDPTQDALALPDFPAVAFSVGTADLPRDAVVRRRESRGLFGS